MRTTRWFDGFACTKCGFPLLFHEDKSRGTSCYAPAGPLILQCPNPACGHQQDYDGCTPEKFCLLPFQEYHAVQAAGGETFLCLPVIDDSTRSTSPKPSEGIL